MEESNTESCSERPVTTLHPVNRLKDLGYLPDPPDGRFDPVQELSISHFPRTVNDLLKILHGTGNNKHKETRLIWVSEKALFMDHHFYLVGFQPIECVPLYYVGVDFCDQYDNGSFCSSRPTYAPTQWLKDTTRGYGKVGIHALSAEHAISVLEQMAQLPDHHEYAWNIDLGLLRTPDLIRRALECLPTTVRREFKFTEKPFPAELCSLVLSPRGSCIRLCFARCKFLEKAQEAFHQAIAAREDADDHCLCLHLDQTLLSGKQNLLALFDSKKVDTLEVGYSVDSWDHECMQALQRSPLRRLGVFPVPQRRNAHVTDYIAFLNQVQWGEHLQELVLHRVNLEGSETNHCLVTLLRRTPGLIYFGIRSGKFSRQQWLDLLDAIRTHPSLTRLDLSGCWSMHDEFTNDRTYDIFHLLRENPRIEQLHGCYTRGYDETVFRTRVEPMLEWNWYRTRIPTLRGISNTSTRDALIGKAFAVLEGKPSVRYLLLSEYCNVIVTHVAERYCGGGTCVERSLKRRRDSLNS